MSPTVVTSLTLLGLVTLLAACDDPPKPAAAEKPAVSAVAPPAVTPSAAPEPVAAPPPAVALPPKKLSECAKGPNAVFDQPGLEDEIRKKLQKPEGAITIAE